jgi:ABC-type transporter Mla subunit MlaD
MSKSRVFQLLFGAQDKVSLSANVRVKLSLQEDLDDLADSLRGLDNRAAAIEGQIDEANRLLDQLGDVRAIVNEAVEIQKEASAYQSAAASVLARYKSVADELGLNAYDDDNFVYLEELQSGGSGTSLENIYYSSSSLSDALDSL